MGRRGGFRDFLEGFNSAYNTGSKMARDFETSDIMDEKPTQAYAQDQIDKVKANVEAGKDAYDGLDPNNLGATKTYYNGQAYDKPLSSTQLDGLRAARIADVYQKYGDPMGAMQLRAQARQATREDRQDRHDQAVEDLFTQQRERNAALAKIDAISDPIEKAKAVAEWYKSVPNGEELIVGDDGIGSLTRGGKGFGQTVDLTAPGVTDKLMAAARDRMGSHFMDQFQALGAHEYMQGEQLKTTLKQLGLSEKQINEAIRHNQVSETETTRHNTATERNQAAATGIEREKLGILKSQFPTDDDRKAIRDIEAQWENEPDPAKRKVLEDKARMVLANANGRKSGALASRMFPNSLATLTDAQKLQSENAFKREDALGVRPGWSLSDLPFVPWKSDRQRYDENLAYERANNPVYQIQRERGLSAVLGNAVRNAPPGPSVEQPKDEVRSPEPQKEVVKMERAGKNLFGNDQFIQHYADGTKEIVSGDDAHRRYLLSK